MSRREHMEDTLIVIQARMSSTRLPRKVLRTMADRPMLQLLIDRLGDDLKPNTVVATSVEASDDPIEHACDEMGVGVIRGDLEDVLSRFVTAVERYAPTTLVRLTGDNPMVDRNALNVSLSAWREREGEQFAGVSNHLSRRTDPYGYSVEVISAERLLWLADQPLTQPEREHVTKGLIDRGLYGEFRILQEDASELRWTVDTAEDFAHVSALFDALGPHASVPDALDWSRRHPHR